MAGSLIKDEETFDAFVRWLNSTFVLESDVDNAEGLTNGLIFAQILSQVDGSYFNDEWLSKLNLDVSDDSNWRVKLPNLKKVVKGVTDYYTDVLGYTFVEYPFPDASRIAEYAYKADLNAFIELIIGMAVNCARREEYIGRIMQLEETVQHVIMHAIQDLEGRQRTLSHSTPSNSNSSMFIRDEATAEEMAAIRKARSELVLKCSELDAQVATLVDEKRALQQENEHLLARLTDAENLDDPQSTASKKVSVLQQQLDKMHEELYRTDSAREDSKDKQTALEKENRELQQKLDELMNLEMDYDRMKDEADEAKAKLAELKKYEHSLETYKKRLEEMSDLKLQLKLLEEKNAAYMKSMIELDEEKRKNGALKTQIEAYKAQMQELQNQLSEQVRKADKFEFEAKRCQEKLETSMREKDRCIAELDTLREINEELKLSQLHNAATNGSLEPGSAGDQMSTSTMLTSTPEIREKLARLEHENKLLKVASQSQMEERTQYLSDMLDSTKARLQEQETECRLARQKVMTLEAEIKDMREAGEGGSTSIGGSDFAEAQLLEKEQEIQRQSLELARLHRQLDGASSELKSRDPQVQELEEQVAKLKSQEAKYRSYLEKARTVIEGLEKARASMPETGIYTREDIENMQKEVAEKEALIQRMQEEQERVRIMREQEERLITTAFHSMAMQLHRKASEERMTALASADGVTSSSGAKQSFLTQQRNVTLRRNAHGPSGGGS